MSIERVVVLWDGEAPDADEVAEVVEFVEPDLDVAATPVRVLAREGASYALASLHLVADEQAGVLSPGAWRGTKYALVEADDGSRLVAVVRRPEAEERGPAEGAVNPWALEPILRHLARIETGGRPDLMDRSAWKELLRPQVLDLVLAAESYPSDGVLDCHAARSGDLVVLVSMFATTDPDRIKATMPGGYMQVLDHYVKAAGVDLDDTEVAHWLLCHDPADGSTAVHLAYLPTRHGQALMPWRLLSEEERKGGLRLA